MSMLQLIVNESTRKLSNRISNQVFVVNDANVDTIRFSIPAGFSDIDIDENASFRVMYIPPGIDRTVYAKTLTFVQNDGVYISYDWQVGPNVLVESGILTVSFCILKTGSEVQEWHTIPYTIPVSNTIHTDDSDEGDESITPTVAQRVAILESMIQRVASGAPIVVASTSAMTDTDQIYVLKTDGQWYYHNGSAWVAGGEYGAVSTDRTLSEDGIPADAKVVGDVINEVKADLGAINDALDITESLFDATTFEITNTSNWAILEKTKTTLSVENLRGFSTGYPDAPLTDIPNGNYVFHGNFANSAVKYFTLRKNGRTVKNIADGDTFTIDDTTYSISFTTGITGVYTITDISVVVSGGEKNAIEVLQDTVSEQEADINNYVKANAENRTIEMLGGYTANQILNASGEVITAGSNIYCVSDFIQVLPSDKLRLTATMYRNNVVMAFYQSDGTFISAVKGEAGTLIDTNVYQFSAFAVVIPSNATQMRISFITALGTVIYYERSLQKVTGYNLIGVTYPWTGLKWACVGDSLTEHNIRTDIHYYDYVAEKTGIIPVVMGASGSGYARLADQNKAFYQRISDVPTDSDVVTIFGSFNDLGAGLPIGSVDDTGTDTLAGCINTTITNLQTVIPLVNLGVVAPTPWNTTPPNTTGTAFDYVEMLKAICEKRSIPFLDLWRCSNLRPWDADFRALAYSKDEGAGTHPDENGHKLIAPRFEGFLKTLLLT